MKTPIENIEIPISTKCEPPLGVKVPGGDPRGPAQLIPAQCCGNCVHVSRPKKPDDHISFYEVPKTERWCYKHNWYITRECVCQDFEPENKKGGIPACKRVFAFNKKAEEIKELRERMARLNISYAYNETGTFRYSILQGQILKEQRCHSRWNSNLEEMEPCEEYWDRWYGYGPKDSNTKEVIKIVKDYLDNFEKNMGGEND